jgi:hypothetical protein
LSSFAVDTGGILLGLIAGRGLAEGNTLGGDWTTAGVSCFTFSDLTALSNPFDSPLCFLITVASLFSSGFIY